MGGDASRHAAFEQSPLVNIAHFEKDNELGA
jgi:hypothetical protein